MEHPNGRVSMLPSFESIERRLPTLLGLPLVRYVNFVLLIALFVINGLSAGTTFGPNQAHVSDSLPNLLVPAGWAFRCVTRVLHEWQTGANRMQKSSNGPCLLHSIWGIIYLFLASWGIYQVLPRSKDSLLNTHGVGYLFLLNAAGNIVWILIWVRFHSSQSRGASTIS